MNVNVLDEASREQFKSNVIEVASFLHQVQAESWGINEVAASEKPMPFTQMPGYQRRTGSGTVYPAASPFLENSNVGICMLLPDEVEQGQVLVDLGQFFVRCPLDDCITSVRWGCQVRGEQRKKKAVPAPDGAAKSGNKFDHCCFVSMQLPDGFQHVSVKVFKSGRLQTAGCRDGKMSLDACRMVAIAMQRIGRDNCPQTLFQYGPMCGWTDRNYLQKLADECPQNVRLQKESILGVFDLGFKERGFNVDMEQLRLLLNHPDNRDRVCKVHVPKSDAKEKVKRFQGLGVYINKDCLTHATNNVFVNIFPTGKCTVTAASSREQAEEVTEVVSKLVIDLFVQCRKRDLAALTAGSKKLRKR
jgi:TATA-box binding protein (TBP) (component of TFIID and TFIIIB)